ncbi:hypothetical protein D3C81_950890 [compost metagenome]
MDTLLALFGTVLGVAHFVGGLFGIPGDILHGVGHFIDCSGYLLHLRRLLFAVLLSLVGVAADIHSRLPQGMRCALQLADHPLQLAGKAVEVFAQLGHFIAAMGVQPAGQVALAAGDHGHGVHRFLQRTSDAAGNQQHQQGHDQGNAKPQQRGIAQLAHEFALHVIDIDPRANHPAPRFEQLDVGSFLDRLAGTGLGPAVVDAASPAGFGQRGHFVENGKAVRITDRGEVLAIEFGVGRMHDHPRPQVVDPEVVVLVVAQAAHGAQGLLLGGFAGQGAGRLEALIVGQYARSGFYHMLGLFGLGLIQVAVDLPEHQQAQGQQHHHGQYQNQPQAAADRHIS